MSPPPAGVNLISVSPCDSNFLCSNSKENLCLLYSLSFLYLIVLQLLEHDEKIISLSLMLFLIMASFGYTQ